MTRRQTAQATIGQDNFLSGLQAWSELVPEERESRAEAMRRIIEARSNGSTSLSLANLKLSSLPPQIGELTDLTTLILVGNQLTTLPERICELTSLETFDINRNQLTTLPDQICKLIALRVLNLYQSYELTPSPNLLDRLSELETRGCEVYYPEEITPEVRDDRARSRLQKSHLQKVSKTLALASYDPKSYLSELDDEILKKIAEFTDTRLLSEAEIKAVFEATKKDVKETDRYKKHAESVKASPAKVIKSEETGEEKYKSDYEDGDEESRLSKERPSSHQASHQGSGGAAAQEGEKTAEINKESEERTEESRVGPTAGRTLIGRVYDVFSSISSIIPKPSMFTTKTPAQPLKNENPLHRK